MIARNSIILVLVSLGLFLSIGEANPTKNIDKDCTELSPGLCKSLNNQPNAQTSKERREENEKSEEITKEKAQVEEVGAVRESEVTEKASESLVEVSSESSSDGKIDANDLKEQSTPEPVVESKTEASSSVTEADTSTPSLSHEQALSTTESVSRTSTENAEVSSTPQNAEISSTAASVTEKEISSSTTEKETTTHSDSSDLVTSTETVISTVNPTPLHAEISKESFQSTSTEASRMSASSKMNETISSVNETVAQEVATEMMSTTPVTIEKETNSTSQETKIPTNTSETATATESSSFETTTFNLTSSTKVPEDVISTTHVPEISTNQTNSSAVVTTTIHTDTLFDVDNSTEKTHDIHEITTEGGALSNATTNPQTLTNSSTTISPGVSDASNLTMTTPQYSNETEISTVHSDHLGLFNDSIDTSTINLASSLNNSNPAFNESLFTDGNVNKTDSEFETPIKKQTTPGCIYEDKERFRRAITATVYSTLDGEPTMLSFIPDTACIGTLSKKGQRTVRSRGLLIPQLPLRLKVEAGMFMHDRLYLFDSSPAQKVWSFKYNKVRRVYSLQAHSVMSIDAFLQLCGIKNYPSNNFRVKAVAQFSLHDDTCILYDRRGDFYLSHNASMESLSLVDSIHYMTKTQFISRIESIFSWLDEPSSAKSVYVYGSDAELYELYRDANARNEKMWTVGKYRRMSYESAPIPT